MMVSLDIKSQQKKLALAEIRFNINKMVAIESSLIGAGLRRDLTIGEADFSGT
jgi:hypothetical protein